MDDKARNSGAAADTNDLADKSPQKAISNVKRKRTPSATRSDKSDSKNRRKSRDSRSKSRSKSRDRGTRRRRSKSRSRDRFSPDRRHGRLNRGGFQRDRDFYSNRRRRSPSRSPPDRFRGRNRTIRRSRSSSYDRYRGNRRNNRSSSRDRSNSRSRGGGGNRPWKKGPMSPMSPQSNGSVPPPPTISSQNQMPGNANFGMGPPSSSYPDTNVYNNNYPPNNNLGAYMPNQQYPNYEYQVPIMQPPPGSFSAYPPPPVMQQIPPPGDEFQSTTLWNMNQIPPPPVISMPPEAVSVPTAVSVKPANTDADEEKQKREAAVALEKKNQRATIRKQRDDYKRRATALKRELKTLKEQRDDLASGNEPPSPTTNGFLKENDRLQAQIENKISTMENVIDMLDGIINNDKSASPSPSPNKVAKDTKATELGKSDDSSPERLKTKVIESLSKKRKDSDRGGAGSGYRSDEKQKNEMSLTAERVNYTFYDPELHWCKTCSAFPKTAKDFLAHLHSDEHKSNVKTPEIPWHDNLKMDDMPSYPNAPTKRTPIRGIQFFVPSTGWYCKLCSIWIGDLHCASSHLKSQTHANEYTKFIQKNPRYETDWMAARQKACDTQRECDVVKPKVIELVAAAPPPPIISAPPQIVPTPPSFASTSRVFDSIPLQINQRPKEPTTPAIIEEPSQKKGKKKKKEKKKRKKSKKKRRSSSTSSSSSSDESSASGPSPERTKISTIDRKIAVDRPVSVEKPAIDTSNSIRVAMRNSLKTARTHIKPKSDDEETDVVGGWTVVQEAKPVAPQAPTISANGEAQNRRDELIISQWNAPESVISEKEKQLLEQLRGRMKSREVKKKEKTPPPQPVRSTRNEEENSSRSNRQDDESRSSRYDRDRDRDRKRRERSSSRDRRDRRSRSPSPTRNRRNSRSPARRDSRRRRSRTRSRERRIEKAVVRPAEFKPRIPEVDAQKEKQNDRKKLATGADKSKSSNATTKKISTTVNIAKKLPFIGRMPVFKKQATEEETKKIEPVDQRNDDEKLIQKKKQDELKFQVQQKQQLLQQQQKHAEAYNLAHPGQFASAYNTHGSIHHVLPPVQEDYDDLMPDPLQYVSLMGAPPPPPVSETRRFDETLHSEPVLPPGIDEDEAAENLEPLSHAQPPNKGVLPKDFQDALSIIFDKGAEKPKTDAPEVVAATTASTQEVVATTKVTPQPSASVDTPQVLAQDESSLSTFMPMDIASMDSQHSQEMESNNVPMMTTTTTTASTMELDEQSQYLLYGTMTDKPLVFNEMCVVTQPHGQQPLAVPVIQQTVTASNDPSLTQNIPTPPIQILDAAGNLTQIPGSMLEVGHYGTVKDVRTESAYEIEKKNKRMEELDDLAMLGIDAEDLAAQCI